MFREEEIGAFLGFVYMFHIEEVGGEFEVMGICLVCGNVRCVIYNGRYRC
jgi:hypothetical protein